MSKFVKNIRFEVEFEGDRVEFSARPVDKASAATLYAVFAAGRRLAPQTPGDGREAPEPTAEDREAGEDAVKALAEAFERHLESVGGLRDSDGNAVQRETLFGTLYFMGLVNDAAAEWAKRSLPEMQPGK